MMVANTTTSADAKAIKKQMCQIGKALYQRNMLAAADGNISYRVSDDKILITPSGLPKGALRSEDIGEINLAGEVLSGRPSSEKLMHLAVYRKCPQARCVIHAHPPTAVAWSIAHPTLTELPSKCMSEVILAVGKIPFVPYARPGTADMGAALDAFLPECRVMILSRHGALSWGESLREALNGMERIEHSALILKNAEELGGISELPDEEIQALRQIRARIGERTL